MEGMLSKSILRQLRLITKVALTDGDEQSLLLPKCQKKKDVNTHEKSLLTSKSNLYIDLRISFLIL